MEKYIFSDFDFSDFWDDSDYALKEYLNEPPSGELIESIESELGYKLPASYIEMMKIHNGGTPINNCFPTTVRTSWAKDHIAITGIMGIGRTKSYSLCGQLGSQFMIDEWNYPNIGVFICDCPSAGHDMIMLDYSICGKDGEPEVVHIDQESDYRKTFLAKDFETFIRGLVNEEVYDTSEKDLESTLNTLKTGRFSDILQDYFQKDKTIDFDKLLRNLFTELTKEKGYFALHADALSYSAYDIQFYLLSINKIINSKEEFIEAYPKMIALGNNEISTGGYAPAFVEGWFNEKLKSKDITKELLSGYKMTDNYKRKILDQIKQFG
jgi:SMI1-KNR4 cell-wall